MSDWSVVDVVGRSSLDVSLGVWRQHGRRAWGEEESGWGYGCVKTRNGGEVL